MLKLRWGADAKAKRDRLPREDLDQLLLALRMLAANPHAGPLLSEGHADALKMPRDIRYYTSAYRNRLRPKTRYVIYYAERDQLDIHNIIVFEDADYQAGIDDEIKRT
jgi:hypothetical protein